MRRQNNKTKSKAVFIALIIIAAAAFLYSSKMFERSKPEILMNEQIYWNLKMPLNVKVSDESGIKRVFAQISDGENNITLINEQYTKNEKAIDFNITFPKTGFYSKKNQYTIAFEAIDRSFWNFFLGNKAVKNLVVTVDTKAPSVFIAENSYKITRGGSAAVIFKVDDENLKDVFVQINSGKQFKVSPLNNGYYMAVIAWPANEENFAAEIVAQDSAGNVAKSKIKYYLQNKTYRVSKIALSDNFLNNSVSPLAEEFDYNSTKDMLPLERFVFLNEKIRQGSVDIVKSVTSQISDDTYFRRLHPFFPLKNGAAVAGFGDFRIYEKNNQKVSKSYHLGLDMASTAEAEIVLSNSGRVAFAGENGIYGKMILIDHGLGIFSLYAHCSSLSVKEGDEAVNGQVIARTGKTGFVFGDHLHFGIVVQGIEVRPEEWMDSGWMSENIFELMGRYQN